MRAALLSLCFCLLWAAGLATAQVAPDYEDWESVAERAETALSNDAVSTITLEELRDEIAGWRDRFLEAESGGEARIETLRAQIEALGPAPEEGANEPPDLAARRATLEDRLATLEAPRRQANEAFNRANGVVGELDSLIRTRQTDALFTLGPSPLNPVNWPDAAVGLFDIGQSILREVQSAWSSEVRRANIRQNILQTVLLLGLSIALLWRGREWMEQATQAIQFRSTRFGRLALGFLVSLGQILVPILGIYVLILAVEATGLLGPRGLALAGTLPLVGLSVFGALWLGARVLPRQSGQPGPLGAEDDERAQGRAIAAGLGILFALSIVVRVLTGFDEAGPAFQAVVTFPIIVLTGLLLFRAGHFLLRAARASVPEGESPNFGQNSQRLVARAILVIALFAPVVAAIGYRQLAEALAFPTVLSLGLAGAIAAIHGPVRDLFNVAFARDDEPDRELLGPVIVTMILTLASLPLFALIWGARPAEIAEVWARFRQGFVLGESRITPGDFLTVIIVFAIGYALTRLIQGTLRNTVLPKTQIDIGGQNAVVAGIGYVGIFLAALIAISVGGLDLSSVAIVAGALSVGIGFGLQTIVSNFVSGIILLVERPIREGDWIDVNGTMGHVRDISVRSTRIETFDRTDVIVPNADLIAGTVTNYTFGNNLGRLVFTVGVAYGSDTRRVEQILREIVAGIPNVVTVPPPSVTFAQFGADSLDFEIRAILRDVNAILSTKSEIHHQIAARFSEEGIEIPFAQRDIWLRNPETLGGQGDGDGE